MPAQHHHDGVLPPSPQKEAKRRPKASLVLKTSQRGEINMLIETVMRYKVFLTDIIAKEEDLGEVKKDLLKGLMSFSNSDLYKLEQEKLWRKVMGIILGCSPEEIESVKPEVLDYGFIQYFVVIVVKRGKGISP
jgi:hypothetical protein